MIVFYKSVAGIAMKWMIQVGLAFT